MKENFKTLIKRGKWLGNTIFTIVLIALIVAIYIVTNIWITNQNIADIDLTKEKLYPIIRCSDPDEAIEIGHAMIKGGIKILEVNIETPDLYRAVQELSKDAYICAGSIITSLQAQMAIDCGAVMFSSPIFQMNLVKISKNKRVPFIAGVSTANEAYAAWKARVLLT